MSPRLLKIIQLAIDIAGLAGGDKAELEAQKYAEMFQESAAAYQEIHQKPVDPALIPEFIPID